MAERNDLVLPPQIRLGEEKERTLRTPQVADHAAVSPRPTAAASTLPLFLSSYPAPRPGPDPTAVAPLFRADMCLRASLCALLLGLVITSSTGRIHRSATLGSLVGLLTAVSAGLFTLRNGYGTVEARYHLTAYDCSEPSEVQAYSSIPASHCSTRATPCQKRSAHTVPAPAEGKEKVHQCLRLFPFQD